MGVVYFSIIPTFEPSRYCKCWIVCFYNKISLFHPKILVVKKPFAYGDMHCRTYILKRMQELKAAGVSILLLTGYLTDCVYISDHIGIVKDGSFSVLLEPQEYGITSRLF